MEPSDTHLPATIQPTELSVDVPAPHVVPALIADLGDQASWRYVEFFTANIRNPNTRRAYARACYQFFTWCEQRGLTLASIRALRRRELHRAAAEQGLGAIGQTAAGGGADAVRLAGDRPGRANQPGCGRAWTK